MENNFIKMAASAAHAVAYTIGPKFVQHGPITIAIDCSGLFLFIFEEKWPNYASGPKSAPNSDSF